VFEMVIDRTFADVKRQQKEIFENSGMSLEDKLKRLFTIVPSYSEVMDYRRVNEIKRVYPQLYQKIHEYLAVTGTVRLRSSKRAWTRV